MNKNPRWPYLLVNLSTLLWASNITLGRALRDQVGPFTLSAARFAIAGIIFAFLLRGLPRVERRPGKDWLWLAGMGFSGVFAFPSLLYLALQRTTASNAALINGTAPLMTALLAGLFLNERQTIKQLIGASISLAGVTLVITRGSMEALTSFQLNSGDLIVVLDVALWGVYSIFSRLATHKRTALSATAISAWMALPFLIAAAVLEWNSFPPRLDWKTGLAGIYIGIFPTVIAFSSWNEGVRRIGPSQAMTFYNMLPVFGAGLGAAFLGETLSWAQFIGGGLVILGGLTAVRRNAA